jgi:hypothetical protein
MQNMKSVTNAREDRKKALLKELEVIKEQEKQEEEDRRDAHAKFCLDNIDALIALTSEHNAREGCSDDKQGDEQLCKRCMLLQAKEYGNWNTNYEVQLDIRKTRK